MELTRSALPALAAALLGLQGCATPSRMHAVPSQLSVAATVVGFPATDKIRYYPQDPGDSKLLEQEFVDSWERERAYLALSPQVGALPPASILSISGGGDNGAYGAGFLNGWTQAGTRPQFKFVTGVSTGALIAPFAFLGPAYDHVLKSMYTEVSPRDIAIERHFYSVFFDDAIADTTPLWHLLRKHVTPELLDAIAAEYQKGRLLFVGTTNLDVRRPLLWNITRIAASHRPEALELVQKILRASAAIPGEFPPVMIGVEADGQPYEEMHVDGSTTAQLFVYWTGIQLQQLAEEHGAQREREIYILRNARLDPDWAEVERRTLPITFRAISTLVQYHGLGDLFRIYWVSQRDGTDFNLAYVPSTFKVPHKEPFDTTYMRALYDVGFEQAAAGYKWAKHPPLLADEGRSPAAPSR